MVDVDAADNCRKEGQRILENEFVVLDKVHECGQVFPAVPSNSCDDDIYWLTGNAGGKLEAQRQDPGSQAPERGIRVALLNATTAKAPRRDEKETTAVGTRLLYTDDKVNIWEFYLPPGTRCHYHQHHLPYFYTNLTESLTQELDDQGHTVNDDTVRLQKINHTTFLTQKELGQHAVLNVGDSPLLQFIVELKHV